MHRLGLAAGILVAIVLAACSGGDSAPEGTATSTPSATPSPTASSAATPSATPSPTVSSAATPSPTASSAATPGPPSEATVEPGACTMYEASTPPATYFGLVNHGDVVRATNVDCGIDCGISRADGAGEWLVVIDRTAACLPRPGHTIAFYLNGDITTHTETWRAGGTPANLVTGIVLTTP